MKRFFSSTTGAISTAKSAVRFGLLSMLIVSVVGCGSLGGRRGMLDSKSSAGAARSPLTTQAVSAARLASVNSVELAIPSISSSGSVGAFSAQEARDIIERSAREIMTLKISVGSDRGDDRRAIKTDSDAVLNTEISRFEERQGSAIGGEPAVVSFRMSLRDRVGAELWSASYFLKQEALSENLLRIKERVGPDGLGAGWRSAHYVFQHGVESALKDLNTQRERQFLSGR